MHTARRKKETAVKGKIIFIKEKMLQFIFPNKKRFCGLPIGVSMEPVFAATVWSTTVKVTVKAPAPASRRTLIAKGTKVKNYGYYNVSNGDIWLYIQFTYKNVIYTGFASKDYLRKK